MNRPLSFGPVANGKRGFERHVVWAQAFGRQTGVTLEARGPFL